MTIHIRACTAAVALAFATATPPALSQQQQQQQGQKTQSWNLSQIYKSGWSAEEMIDSDVRGANGEEIGEVKDIIIGKDGKINHVVVEVGGFLEMGDQHIGVPWKDVTIGADMEYVQVPLKEIEAGTYSLFGRVPQGEEVYGEAGSWRVNELIGDYASLRDVPRYGLVTDVIFNEQGQAQGVVVDRARGSWGAAGRYAYPWTGYDRDVAAYPLPYGTSEVAQYERFDYVELGKLSKRAGTPDERASAAGSGASQRNSSQQTK